MSEKRFTYGETDLFEWVEDNGKMISTKECVNKLNEQQDTIEGLLLDRNRQEEKLDIAREKLEKQVKQMKKDEKSIKTMLKNMGKLKEENEELRNEKDGWKSSACHYLNKESVLSRDMQIVHEALSDLGNSIETGTGQEKLFEELKEKFNGLVNRWIEFDDE